MWQVYFKELTELLRDKKTLIFCVKDPVQYESVQTT